MKKYGYPLIFIGCIILGAFSLCFFIFVHTPYQNHQNELDRIRHVLVTKDVSYGYGDMEEYYGSQVYYLLKASKGDKNYLFVYDESLNYVDKYSKDFFDKEALKKIVKEEYDLVVDDQHIHYGYDQGVFMYVVSYSEGSHLDYLYFRLNDGIFIKSISFGG